MTGEERREKLEELLMEFFRESLAAGSVSAVLEGCGLVADEIEALYRPAKEDSHERNV